MNEITAEKSGTITAVLVEDGTPVQYGDALFRIK
jgi:oxaloacetate decarboxylase alpha subunit/acetyl-CoA carboxylase biotin carboxyl carrier protein